MRETPTRIPEETSVMEGRPETQSAEGNTKPDKESVDLAQKNLDLQQRLAEAEKDREAWRYLADHDELTDLLNRGGLRRRFRERHLDASTKAARPEDDRRPEKSRPKSGSMLVLDVDNFKVINDAYDHSVGDDVLRAVAEHLRSKTRAGDYVARWGGEEFVIIFDSTDSRGVQSKLYVREGNEEVGKARMKVEAVIEGESQSITLSGGVADFEFDEDLDKVFRRADAAMYQAKNSGKNRIFSAGRGTEAKADPSSSGK